MALKPITVWNFVVGPNPKKIFIILEELGIPYEKINIANPKEESFLKINPNGRLPAIKDPNNDDFILWESGAIIEYLIETYDKEGKLNLPLANDRALLKQYLFFEVSGQGPYYGQGVWFHKLHPEDLPSVKKRYSDQTVRVMEVLDGLLKGKQYLVGDKCTYADLSFVPWDVIVTGQFSEVTAGYDVENKYPHWYAWHKRLVERPSVKKVYADA
ncbi:Glutathione S-transferase-like protein gedE [Cladobotryum mycophilum]|uniref:Glutathione S-transferase-like protein gedE n=1 Tax=Cladobotryum mycophilum TaxID=491253 RepID=A0ABR0T3H0_9HYPO